ncbi:hypothetical protein [Mucilaginibacter sp. HD30]
MDRNLRYLQTLSTNSLSTFSFKQSLDIRMHSRLHGLGNGELFGVPYISIK